MSSATKLEARSITKRYLGHEVLSDVDLRVQEGQVRAILGPSGSGKSTLLRILALLEPASGGQILLNGDEIGAVQRGSRTVPAPERILAEQRTNLGMVFQNFNLFPNMTALGNVTLGPRVVRREPRGDCEERAEALLERVGLRDHKDKFPSELSGGQQQRVAIARALILSPEVMLFDEPTSALDPELVREVLAVMEDLAHEGMTMVVVTHEIGFARSVADTVTLFDQGRLVDDAPPDQFFSSDASERTREFLQHVL